MKPDFISRLLRVLRFNPAPPGHGPRLGRDHNNSTCVRRIDSWPNRHRRCGGVHARCNGMATESLLVESIRKTGFPFDDDDDDDDVASIAETFLSLSLVSSSFPVFSVFSIFSINPREESSCHFVNLHRMDIDASDFCKTSFHRVWKTCFNLSIIGARVKPYSRQWWAARWLNWILGSIEIDNYNIKFRRMVERV